MLSAQCFLGSKTDGAENSKYLSVPLLGSGYLGSLDSKELLAQSQSGVLDSLHEGGGFVTTYGSKSRFSYGSKLIILFRLAA